MLVALKGESIWKDDGAGSGWGYQDRTGPGVTRPRVSRPRVPRLAIPRAGVPRLGVPMGTLELRSENKTRTRLTVLGFKTVIQNYIAMVKDHLKSSKQQKLALMD